jgi:hypothetical protein
MQIGITIKIYKNTRKARKLTYTIYYTMSQKIYHWKILFKMNRMV